MCVRVCVCVCVCVCVRERERESVCVCPAQDWELQAMHHSASSTNYYGG